MSNYSPKNFSPAKKQSLYQYQTHKRNKTQNIQDYSEYQQYIPPKKRKFIQNSIFLPVIHNKQSVERSSRDRQGKSGVRRQPNSAYNYYQDDQLKQSNSQQSVTMEYINQCQKIIQNLKKLTSNSTNLIERKKPRLNSINEKTNTKQLYKDQQISLGKDSRNRSHNNNSNYRIKSNSLRQPRAKQDLNYKVKTSAYQHNPENNTQAKSKKNLNENYDKKINTYRSNQKQDHEKLQIELKAQQELQKAQKKQNILIKFLGKAKNRGFQLHKKITEFKMKKSLQQKQQEQKNAQKNNAKTQSDDKAKNNPEIKNSNPQKNSTTSPQKLPQIKKDTKQKKSK